MKKHLEIREKTFGYEGENTWRCGQKHLELREKSFGEERENI